MEVTVIQTLVRFLVRRTLPVISLLAAMALSIGICQPAQAMDAIQGGALPDPLPLFPPDNWWNRDISSWPVDPDSASYISFINNGGTRHLHPDFGGDAPTQQDPYGIYGMPYVVVSGATTADLVAVEFYYSSESDGVDHATDTSYPFYPISLAAISQPHWIEGGDPGNVDLRSSQDRHLLVVDYDRNMLYELYNVYYNAQQGQWYAGSGAFFDMNSNDRRPDGWTSADAAGLAILPGLVRYDEVYDSNVAEIRHAFRVTVRATNGYVYPASHRAGSTQGTLPMGARLRLKSSVDVTQRTSDPNIQKIFRAMQKYGLIVADNGSDMFITGTYDTRWDNDILNPAFYALTASDFEVIRLGYNPSVGLAALSALSVSPSSVTGGQPATGTVTLTAAAPAGGIVVDLLSGYLAATVPATVTVNAGATSANFTVTTSPVSSTTIAAITATYAGATKTATLAIMPPAISLAAAALPSSRSVEVGVAASAFATILNAGPATALGCALAPVTPIPATFSYQATNAQNQLTGTPNTPANIPAGQGQSYVFAFTPTAPFPQTEIALSFACTNGAAPSLSGVNTFFLRATTDPAPDIVAVALTPSADGILRLASAGAFAVATINLGAAALMTVTADTGGVALPLTLTLCETNSQTGQCLDLPSPTVQTQIDVGATPTFGVFADNGTQPIAFDPTNNRIRVRFEGGGGGGGTSVAVCTQPLCPP